MIRSSAKSDPTAQTARTIRAEPKIEKRFIINLEKGATTKFTLQLYTNPTKIPPFPEKKTEF